MNEQVELPPHLLAGLVAPAVDRVFTGAMRAGHEQGGAELIQRYGGPAASSFLVKFRTRLAAPAGTVSSAGFAAVTRYRDRASCQRALDKQVAYGMIHRRPDGGFMATERGASFLVELYRLHGEVTRELWAEHTERVTRLVDALGRVISTALTATADEDPECSAGFATMAPPYEPDGTPLGVLLINRLDALHHHRADAYALTWASVGHTARSILDLPAGAERFTIEQETNRRAGGAYAVLSPEERLVMLADLAALPAWDLPYAG